VKHGEIAPTVMVQFTMHSFVWRKLSQCDFHSSMAMEILAHSMQVLLRWRYTEARLAQAAMAMVAEAEEDTVDFGPNYDGQLESSVLPLSARIAGKWWLRN
jgi:hypothetical protein